MAAGWAEAVIALGALVVTAGGVLWRDGRRDGRIDALLERLTGIAEDHEDRLRIVEGRSYRRRANR